MPIQFGGPTTTGMCLAPPAACIIGRSGCVGFGGKKQQPQVLKCCRASFDQLRIAVRAGDGMTDTSLRRSRISLWSKLSETIDNLSGVAQSDQIVLKTDFDRYESGFAGECGCFTKDVGSRRSLAAS